MYQAMIFVTVDLTMCVIMVLPYLFSRQSLSLTSTHFKSTILPNVDILDLYYDFLAYNLSIPSQTLTTFEIRSSIQCSGNCLASINFKCVAFAYDSRKRSCLLLPKLVSRNRISSKMYKRIPSDGLCHINCR